MPGLAEEVEIAFHPTEWRYYCDCIRVQVQVCPSLDCSQTSQYASYLVEILTSFKLCELDLLDLVDCLMFSEPST